jgi:hypothetical protein
LINGFGILFNLLNNPMINGHAECEQVGHYAEGMIAPTNLLFHNVANILILTPTRNNVTALGVNVRSQTA